MQPDTLTDDDDDHAETPRRLDCLALLYLFLVFLLGAALQSSVNFVHYSHSNPLPPLDVVALQGYLLLVQALLEASLPLDRIPGLRHQDPSEGVGLLTYAEMHSVGEDHFQ